MKDSVVGIVVAAVAVVVFGGIYFLTPQFVSADKTNAETAARSVAKAERLLARYSGNYAALDAVETRLAMLDVPADLTSAEDVAAALESDQLVADVSTAIRQLAGAASNGTNRPQAGSVENLQQLGVPEQMVGDWFAAMGAFGQVDRERFDKGMGQADAPMWFGQFGGAPNASQIKAYRQALESAKAQNAKLLDEALKAADEAVAADSNSTRAHQVRGSVFLSKAQLAQRVAALKASEAQPIRVQILELANRIDELQQAETDYRERRKLADAIADAEMHRGRMETQLAEAVEYRDIVAAELLQLQSSVDAALNDLNATRNQLDTLTDAGFDKGRYGSFASYQSAVDAASRNWRDKAHVYQVLTEGTLSDGGEAQLGIAPRTRELRLAEKTVEQLTTQAAEAEASVSALNALRGQLDEVSRLRENELTVRRSEIEVLLDEESRLSAEARAAEESAMEQFSVQAARSFANAQQSAGTRNRPEGEGEIADKLRSDNWLEASLKAEQAAASLEQAAAAAQRINDLRSRLQMVVALEAVGVGELTVAAIEEQIGSARETAVAAADRALEQAQKAQRQDDQWFYEGMIGAIHLTAWLADPGLADRKDTAILSFEDAINGREDTNFAAPYRRVLSGLKAIGS